ncbi:MAG TPA: hypothetical protein VJ826_00420 [Candidatus Polarisedimenticolaceae bacterium]|nr:hypothetical protein [Candidatus Polarisedimenticolaceae bacterium]
MTPTPEPGPTATPTPRPTPPPTPPPAPSGTLRLEVTGNSCAGDVRWTLNGSTHDEDHDFPWSRSLTAHRGDSVSLRACSKVCGEAHEVTITVSIFWNGNRIETRTQSGRTKKNHCQPSSSVDATLP